MQGTRWCKAGIVLTGTTELGSRIFHLMDITHTEMGWFGAVKYPLGILVLHMKLIWDLGFKDRIKFMVVLYINRIQKT